MRETNTPECLWDVCLSFTSKLRCHTALNIRELRGEVPQTVLKGDTADISHLVEFGWYDWVWHKSPEDESKQNIRLGRYCGPSFEIGEAMCSMILSDSAEFLHRTSVYPLSPEELESEAIKEKQRAFTDKLNEALKRKGKKSSPPSDDEEDPNPKYTGQVPTEPERYEPILPEAEVEPELADDLTDTEYKTFDRYLSAKVLLPRGEQKVYGQVVGRKRDSSGNLIGKSNPNPLLDTSVYEIKLEDGSLEEYTANVVAESIYAQVDDEGYTLHLVDEIIDHRKSSTKWRVYPSSSTCA